MSIRNHCAAWVALVLPLAASPLFAATSTPAETTTSSPIETFAGQLTGIEAMSSTVMQEGQSSFSGLAIRVRLHPPQLMQQIELLPTIEYWRNANTVQPYDIRTTRKDATVGVDARWNFSTATFKPYAGVGYALHFLSNTVHAPGFGIDRASDSVTKGGIALLGGVSFALSGKFDNFLDVKYHHVTDYRQLKINWGISYNL
jgi:hypothetical protein